MEVFLVRHGPAETRDPVRWPDDEDRPLSREGIDQTRKAGRGFARLDLPVARIIASPAIRAKRTAELFRDALEFDRPIETWNELSPETSASAVLKHIADDARRSEGMVLFGHEPTLSEVIGLAMTGEAVSLVHFARAGAAALLFQKSVAPGTGQLDWLLTRRQLVALAR